MTITSAHISIAVISISLIVGVFAYYLISDLPKEEKKKLVGELTSQLINFVIYIWIGKILLKIPLFVQDPLSVLAYPSNSNAFYIAVLFSTITIFIKTRRQQLDILVFLNSFLYVFLIASFVYEFIQIVWLNNTTGVPYMVLLSVLIVLLLFIRNRISTLLVMIIVLNSWITGTLVLTFLMPYTTVFGYTVVPWFLGLCLIAFLIILLLCKRKNVRR